MKIEKGKLYYSPALGEINKSTHSYEIEEGLLTNKIAVHCPTNEDVEYLKSKYKNIRCAPRESFYPDVYIRIDRDSSFDVLSRMKRDDYHIISIDQFKEFYPPMSKEEQKELIVELSNSEPYPESVISNKTNDNDPVNPTHYNQYAIQPLDYIEANGFDFCEGNVIKYVSRYKQKNGLEDLKKARVYLDKLIKRYEK